MHPTVRLLALNWSIDQPPAIVHNLLSDRILGRGANHQTLHADTSAARAHEEVLWMFLKQVEDLSPSDVDVVVDMDLTRTPEEMLRHAVDACVRELGLPQPSEEKIQEALVVTQRYQASSTQAPETKTKERSPKGPRYYGLLPEVDLTATLDGLIADAADGPKDFWARLKKGKRVAKQPHVTLVHQKGLPADQALWDACSTVVQAKSAPLFSMRLSTLLWNERVMALVVDDLAISSDKPDTEGTGVNFTLQLPQELRQRLHVTVGTWSESIPPFEARALVEAWRHGKTEKMGILPLKDVFTIGRVKGLFS
jgi:tRNA ligase